MSIPFGMKQIAGMLFGLSLSAVALGSSGSQVDLNTKNVRAGGTPVGDLIRVPIERVAITENVFYVSGLANVYMVNTPEGAVVIDTGFAHQAPEQMALLKEVMKGSVKVYFPASGTAG